MSSKDELRGREGKGGGSAVFFPSIHHGSSRLERENEIEGMKEGEGQSR